MCPKCDLPLAPDSCGIKRCRDCGGVWLDADSMAAAEQEERFRGRLRQLQDLVANSWETASPYDCPDCSGRKLVMRRIGNVDVEWCPQCRSIFLDVGELPQITRPREIASAVPGTLAAATDGASILGYVLETIFDW